MVTPSSVGIDLSNVKYIFNISSVWMFNAFIYAEDLENLFKKEFIWRN
jgi:hypothetical protein